ncbi:WxL protein peptidoglycan domain-containing protein [Dactylosporangium sp. NPDC048998]|uniref:WxL protein peptidoglycan domain-containing protein n=1 Tax=Dactylosporangium sp. NPDC048998 TaxID=3363976 RepID=UPI00371D74E7
MRRTLASAVAALAAAALPLVVPAAPAAAQPADGVSWGVAPAANAFGTGRARFEYGLDPGTRIADGIVVANHGAAPITLRVYAGDAFTTRSGGIDLQPTGTTPKDVGAWIKVSADTVTVAAGAAVTVAFTLTVPADATPGDHVGGLVTTLVDEAAAGGVRVEHRLGSRVYARVSGTLRPALTITDVQAEYAGTVDPTGTGPVRITYTVRNTGNVRLSGREQATVAGPFGLLSRDAAGELPEILPGNALTRTVTVRGVWPATRLTARIDVVPAGATADPVPRASAATALWTAPWGQLLVLAGVAAAVAGVLALRRRSKRRVAAAISAAVDAALAASRAGEQAPVDAR